MRKILSLIVLTVLISCQSTISPSKAVTGEEIELEYGKKVLIQDENISVTFKSILDDSRCPEGLQCVWAGNARIAVQLDNKEGILNSYLEPDERIISGYKVKLISITPYPKNNVDIRNEDYSITLLISK